VRPAARPCASADLPSMASILNPNDGISEQDDAILTVHNVGSSRCTLAGRVSVTSSGVPIDTRPDERGLGEYDEVPATVDPGETAYVRIGVTVVCNGGIGTTTKYDIALTYAGKSISVPGLSLRGSCPYAYATQWYRQLPQSPGANPYPGLEARVE